ncbi:MAG: LysE family translocator [Pseudomonadota bacterium]
MTHAAWPVTPEAIIPFLIAVTLIELTPGPNMGYLAALSAMEGRGAGLRAVAGVTVGLSVYMLASVFGVAELIAAAPIAYALLRWAGVAYLLYLAWEAWRGASETSPGHEGLADHAPFVRGLVANLLNPKAAVFYISLLPGFVAPDHAPFWAQALVFGCAHIGISIVVHTLIVFGAASAGVALAQFEHRREVRRGMALAIAAIALWLAFSPRS